MIVLIDNYDSFTYNLYGMLPGETIVIRNDDPKLLQTLEREDVKGIILSPGPGHPKDAGLLLHVISQFSEKLPILGICLGHQAISLAFGGEVTSAPTIMHGKCSKVRHENKGLFKNLPQQFQVMRYHSLTVPNVPSQFEIAAVAIEDESVMAMTHRVLPVYGLQFHPESFMTEYGSLFLERFVQICNGEKGVVAQ